MRLLLVEDDIKIALFVKNGLKEAGFAVDHETNGENGLHLALTEPYDLAIIDLMLPKVDGLTLVEKIRKNEILTPILINLTELVRNACDLFSPLSNEKNIQMKLNLPDNVIIKSKPSGILPIWSNLLPFIDGLVVNPIRNLQ